MKVTPYENNQDGIHVVVRLLSHHQSFHQYLDQIAASTNDVDVINLLIEIRRFNIDTISSYTGLLSKKNMVQPKKSKMVTSSLALLKEEDMTLWNIHTQLTRLIPLYNNALHHKNLSQVYRMMISNVYDKLIVIKEDLLHPVDSIEMA